MKCEFCGRDETHLRYDPVTWEPIGCIGCMPEEAPNVKIDFPNFHSYMEFCVATTTPAKKIEELKSLTRLQIPNSGCCPTPEEGHR